MTLIGKVEGEEKRTTCRGSRIKSRPDVVDPSTRIRECRYRRETDEEEGEGIDIKWNRQTVDCLETAEENPPDKRRDEINR